MLASTKEKLGPYAVMSDAQQLLFVDDFLWLLHREQSCVTRLDPQRGVELGSGVPVGPYPYSIRHHNGIVYVADYGDNSILAIDASSARPNGRPIMLGPGARLTDVDAYGGSLVAIDTARDRVLILGAAAREARHAERPYRATEQYPQREQR